jgi:uncharacterized protein (TIGR03437 family)
MHFPRALLLSLYSSLIAQSAQLTPAPAGPYRVSGNRILDAKGRPYLTRGTELPALTLNAYDVAGDGREFGAFSPSSLVSIRQRLNMNAVRLPLDARAFVDSAAYRERALDVVRTANHFELLVILAAQATHEVPVRFWPVCAEAFKSFPNVFFAPAASASDWPSWKGEMQSRVDAIRAQGAAQPVLLPGIEPISFAGLMPELRVRDANVIYSATPRYTTMRSAEDRRSQFGEVAARAPVLVNDLDPRLDQNSSECAAFPHDPGAATQLLQEYLDWFDAHQVSWILSSYRPGRMLTEYRYFNWSKLDDGWTCGEAPSHGGIAMVLAAHLWGVDPHGLFPVNHVNGGLVLARGGLSTAYGPILADREATASARAPLPLRLANVSVRVTDSRGVARRAALQYTGAGWSNITFVVPAAAAPGPAEVAVVRTDGSVSTAKVILADIAPGFFSASADARGAAVGEVTQYDTDTGETRRFAVSECSGYVCRAVPITLSPRLRTTVRLAGSGFRNAGPGAMLQVTVGGIVVRVLSFGAMDDVGRDQVTIELPASLGRVGEADLAMTVNGRLSNVVRIHCGAE